MQVLTARRCHWLMRQWTKVKANVSTFERQTKIEDVLFAIAMNTE